MSVARRLRIRLRADRINAIRSTRLMIRYLEGWQANHAGLKPGLCEHQQASTLAELELTRRRITANDIKRVREAKKLGLDWQGISETLADTRLYRILGWE